MTKRVLGIAVGRPSARRVERRIERTDLARALLTAELRATLTRLNDLITGDVAKLQDALARQHLLPAVSPVKLP